MKAKWTHDCNACKYLGSSITSQSTGNHRTFDWYECNDTTVARYGDYGPDYWSMPTTMIKNDDYIDNPIILLARFMLVQQRQ